MQSNIVRAILQWLASLVGGAILGFLGGIAGGTLVPAGPGGFGDLVGAIFLGLLGFVVGAGLGAYFAGKRLSQPTRWWLALLSALVAAVLVFVLAEPLRLNSSTTLLQTVMAIAVPTAAVFIPRIFIKS